jgi:phosphoadenosine phosphosulfate reductase
MIIRNGNITEDDWSVLRPTADEAPGEVAVPEGKVIVPLQVWLAQRNALRGRGDAGVWFASSERSEDLSQEDLAILRVVAVDFPKFADGRGYSIAYRLRNRQGYRGELRAIGDVLRDQLFYMQRVGFDAFETRQDKDIHEARKGLKDFAISYQASTDNALPLFRRVNRGRDEVNTLQDKINQTIAVLRQAAKEFTPVVFANSLGAEDMVLTDLIAKHQPDIQMFSLDTGRLPKETYDLIQEVEQRYTQPLHVYFPDSKLVEEYVTQHGINGFYDSVENRKGCCFARKVEPLRRALKGNGAWITGMRRDQAVTRGTLEVSSFDVDNGLQKFNPLLDWSNNDVWTYIRQYDVPYNKLHDQFYPSLGCAPCTRSITPGEDIRAGRWWWENPESKECGLHVSSTSLKASRDRIIEIASHAKDKQEVSA